MMGLNSTGPPPGLARYRNQVNESSCILFPGVKDDFPNFAPVEGTVALGCLTEVNNFVNQAGSFSHPAKDVLPLD